MWQIFTKTIFLLIITAIQIPKLWAIPNHVLQSFYFSILKALSAQFNKQTQFNLFNYLLFVLPIMMMSNYVRLSSNPFYSQHDYLFCSIRAVESAANPFLFSAVLDPWWVINFFYIFLYPSRCFIFLFQSQRSVYIKIYYMKIIYFLNEWKRK